MYHAYCELILLARCLIWRLIFEFIHSGSLGRIKTVFLGIDSLAAVIICSVIVSAVVLLLSKENALS